ncbi:hypothetical protein CPB84DRAFT_565050 [Gymnopilus junonius]|uniref:F-box domain-containing protein n=1 Tax=Gymnopilus junonius TaxID=109634 RepID=A0A9P5TQZ9_GYMJU|nr:hypothetical protein CPB84DRAFT_565050 [Gymnopilus junonius]
MSNQIRATTAPELRRPMVPLEIVDMIIEMLANDDNKNSLKCCSLACHAFLEISRKYLFSSITIYHQEKDRNTFQAHQFQRLLNGNPSIADHVRHLDYRTNDERHPARLFYTTSIASLLSQFG